MNAIEAARASYRPNPIKVLLVGESAPVSGDFLYLPDRSFRHNAIFHHMRRPWEDVIGVDVLRAEGDFLDFLKKRGIFVYDLSPTPVNDLKGKERRDACKAGKPALVDLFRDEPLLAVVTFVSSIKDIVEAAAREAGSNARLFVVPFPGMGRQGKHRIAMTQIIPTLMRLTADESRPPTSAEAAAYRWDRVSNQPPMGIDARGNLDITAKPEPIFTDIVDEDDPTIILRSVEIGKD